MTSKSLQDLYIELKLEDIGKQLISHKIADIKAKTIEVGFPAAVYQLYVATEPRDMTAMLLVQFTPADVLPANTSGSVDVKILDDNGTILAQTQATMVPNPTDEQGTNKAPFGTFTMTFTGGAEVRGK